MPKKKHVPTFAKYPYSITVPDWIPIGVFRTKHYRTDCIVIKGLKETRSVRFAAKSGLATFEKWLSSLEKQAPAPQMRRSTDKFLGTDLTLTMSKADWERVSHALSDQLCWNKGFVAARPDDSDTGLYATHELSEFNRRIKTILHA